MFSIACPSRNLIGGIHLLLHFLGPEKHHGSDEIPAKKTNKLLMQQSWTIDLPIISMPTSSNFIPMSSVTMVATVKVAKSCIIAFWLSQNTSAFMGQTLFPESNVFNTNIANASDSTSFPHLVWCKWISDWYYDRAGWCSCWLFQLLSSLLQNIAMPWVRKSFLMWKLSGSSVPCWLLQGPSCLHWPHKNHPIIAWSLNVSYTGTSFFQSTDKFPLYSRSS